ncbi:MAG: hypothetical protein JXR48_04600 [Candidatus Delongbacteria bacterium]|nr:hypothetical protein [Candidatus Delongbacteria bacterium]MBN2834227.1 hypothetical protein [Candidatus Delongbacteria bacterium]
MNNSICIIYYSSDLCNMCKPIGMRLKAMLSIFEKVDFEERRITSSIYENEDGVLSAPTIIVKVDGKEYIRKTGNVSIVKFEEEFKRLYDIVNG